MNSTDYHAHYQFVEAVRQNNLDFIFSRIEDGNFQSKNPFFWTPLHYAAAFDNFELTQKLLNSNQITYLDYEDRYQRTPLSIAARRGNLKIISLLLSQGANLQNGLALCHAVTSGDVDCVLALIESGCNINELDWNHDGKARLYKPLLIAIDRNCSKIVQLLIDCNAYTGLEIHTNGKTPLHYACSSGTIEMVKALVPSETRLDRRSTYGYAALDFALLHRKLDIVTHLLQAGASVNSVGEWGENALHNAVMSRNVSNVLEVLKYFPDINKRDNFGRTPFYLCCCYCETEEIFDLLIESNVDVGIGCYGSWTPLHLCCAVASSRRVTLILEKISEGGVNTVTMNNVTPLYLAVCTGNVKICRDLLDKGAYSNIRINRYKDLCSHYPFHVPEEDIVAGYTAESIAAEKGRFHILDLLSRNRNRYPYRNLKLIEIMQGKNLNENYFSGLNLRETDLLGWTCLHYAAELGEYKLAEFCIDRYKDVNITDKYGRTPLTLAAANGNMDLVGLLIRNGASGTLGSVIFYVIDNHQLSCLRYLLDNLDVEILDRRKRTPVMYAVIKNNFAILDLLLQAYTNVKQTDYSYETALHHASYSSPAIVQALIRKFADVNAQNYYGETPLFSATVHKNYDIMKVLLANFANVNVGNDYQETPLHYAARTNDVASVEIILQYFPNVNTADSDSYTPLHHAATFRTTDVFKLLLKHGACTDKTLRGGWSLWHICAYHGNLEVARELFKHNTDINALTHDGVSPLCVAAAEGQREFVEMLIEMGAIIDTPTMGLGDWREEPLNESRVPRFDRTTPITAAIYNQHNQIAEILQSAGASV